MFKKNCRICLTDQSDNLTILFTIEEKNLMVNETGQMYLDCLRLELIDKKDYPKHICNYCKLQLSVFHNFTMMAKRSYEKFTKIGIEIKVEKAEDTKFEIIELEEPNDDSYLNKTLANYSRSNEAEYLDSELEEDTSFDVTGIGNPFFNEVTADQPEEEIMDDCIVEYLDDDDVITNVKQEIIEVNDRRPEEGDQELHDVDVISYNYSADDTDQILEPLSKSKTSNIPAFFQLEMLDEGVDDAVDDMVQDDQITNNADDSAVLSQNDYACKQCKFIFSSAEQLRQHFSCDPKCRLDCDLCGKKFKTRIMYQSHMNVHKGLPAFKCGICEKTFNFRSNYQTHMLLHTNIRPYQCNLCDKGFRAKWDLIIHIRVHNDIRKYECKICGKRFRVSSHLTAHQYTHAEEKRFECDVCHQRYISPRTLKQHKNTVHSDVSRFHCSQCNKKFKRKHHVISHLKTHYKNNNAGMSEGLDVDLEGCEL